MNHLILARRPDLVIINKKKKKEKRKRKTKKQKTKTKTKTKKSIKKKKKHAQTCRIVDFAVPADDWVKLKENEKTDKYLDHARELKKLWNMRVTVIPVVIGTFGTVTKGLVQGPECLEIRG